METIFGNTDIKAQAKITRKNGKVEVVDVTEQVLKDNPGLLERMLHMMKKES